MCSELLGTADFNDNGSNYSGIPREVEKRLKILPVFKHVRVTWISSLIFIQEKAPNAIDAWKIQVPIISCIGEHSAYLSGYQELQ